MLISSSQLILNQSINKFKKYEYPLFYLKIFKLIILNSNEKYACLLCIKNTFIYICDVSCSVHKYSIVYFRTTFFFYDAVFIKIS